MSTGLPEFDGIASAAGGLVAGLAGAFLGMRRFLRIAAGERLATDKIEAETQVVALLRAELDRMVAQNAALADELNALQLRIIELGSQIGQLTVENAQLNQQITALREHIDQLDKRE